METGCVTFAEINCVAGNVTANITFWRSCANDRAWKKLPADAYALKGGVCALKARTPREATRCLGSRCDAANVCQLMTTGLAPGWTEEDECEGHASGRAAGRP